MLTHGFQGRFQNILEYSRTVLVYSRTFRNIRERSGISQNVPGRFGIFQNVLAFTGQKIKNFSHVYRRLHRNEPSITLVPGHNAFPIHPWLNRLITAREAARIQTFPDNLILKGSSKDQCIQVGNAFPCLLAELLGDIINKTETNNWFGKIFLLIILMTSHA